MNPNELNANTDAILAIGLSNLFALCTLIVKGVMDNRKAKIDRQAEVEDREIEHRNALELLVAQNDRNVRQVAAETRLKVEERAEKLKEAVQISHDQVVDLITANTEISKKAFHEANTVNTKLEALGLGNKEKDSALVDKIDDVKDISSDTNKKVTNIAKKL